MSRSTPSRPEILASAGDAESLEAALEAGADAVYLGLDTGFNARARAANFSLENLDEVARRIRRSGARSYLTLNTLIFESELERLVEVLRVVACSGIDALIVQDPAVAILAREVCPQLELHASTQMTISSPEAARFAEGLGVRRVVLSRELSVEEIQRFAEGSPLELEVFIHGALCVAWSGQCLSSEAWGGRSANRGECAQVCRLPYRLVIDGERRDLGSVQYLLSPKDLAGGEAVAELRGRVHGLKIEGRQKGAQYVATAVRGYRALVDSLDDPKHSRRSAEGQYRCELTKMALSYTRGFSRGFLFGSNHQSLVEGHFPKHRGVYLGNVIAVERGAVLVSRERREVDLATGGLAAETAREVDPSQGFDPVLGAFEVRAGQGIVFDSGRPEDEEPGGPIFGVEARRDHWRIELGRPGPDLRRVSVGDRVWVTSDPSVGKRQTSSPGRIPVRMVLKGSGDEHLTLTASCLFGEATVVSEQLLVPASGEGLSDRLLLEKLGQLGDTPFRLAELDCTGLESGWHLPVSELKALRREVARALEVHVDRRPVRRVTDGEILERPKLPSRARTVPELVPLCRTAEQLEAVIDGGFRAVELDWMELVGLARAVERARSVGLEVTIATVRVQKPGEEAYDARVEALDPDGVLVRHWGGLMHFAQTRRESGRPRVHGDFSLNVTNSITARHLLACGADTLTASHDLDRRQLVQMLEHVPADRFTVVVHHHVLTFHTEHCVYSHLLSHGQDYRTCGRPCEQRQVSLEDRAGFEHPVVVDVGCRNTVFNAKAQSAAFLVPDLIRRSVGRLRVECVRETRTEAALVLAGYRALIAGELTAKELVRRIGAVEQYGVTRGTMAVQE